MLTVRQYDKQYEEMWNDFVARSRNATFLFNRGYADYHADRFVDNSLIFTDGNRPVTLFLASRHDDELRAHGGLTYGGFVMPEKGLGGAVMVDVAAALTAYCKSVGIRRLLYKPVPHIYHRYPAEEDVYALFAGGAVMSEAAISSAIDLAAPLRPDDNTRRGLRRADKAGVTVRLTDDYDSFWRILSENLAERHGTVPVHTVGEMRLLASRFPDNICLYGSYSADGEMLAGSVLYLTDTVAHTQYISASPRGREQSALVPLMLRAIDDNRGLRRYFDFGISTEDHGRILNAGLLRQKEGFGGRATLYTAYTLAITEGGCCDAM